MTLDMNALDDLVPPVTPFSALRCKSLDEVLALSHRIPSPDGSPSKKRRTGYADKDMRPMAFARVNTRRGKPKPVTTRALLDSGASETLINKKYVQKLKIKRDQNSSTVWSTPGGEMKTNEKVQLQFTLLELQDCCLLYTSPSPRDLSTSRMPSSA